jgi:ABC-type branched-subunit amino acid transport system ATPase component/ABC-type branched-subunit amino acid transport system permease subunit
MRAFAAVRRTWLAAALFIILVALYPLLWPDSYHLGVGIAAGTLAISAVGMVLLIGLAEQLAIGQPAFSMVGGYANALLCTQYGWDPFAAMLLGAAVSMVIAYVIATPILKLRGFALAMATLALQLMLIVCANELPFTGGPMGVTGLPKFAILGVTMTQDRTFFYFVWLVVLICVWIGINIDHSRIGRALRAIAVSETAAGSVGIDVTRYKADMFVIGAGMASVSGSLLVHYLRATDPTVFGFSYGLNLITGVIIGGLSSIWGGVLGSAVIVGLRELLQNLNLPLWESVIMGALTVIVLVVFPRGIAGFIAALYDRLLSSSRRGRVSLARLGQGSLPRVKPPEGEGGRLLEIAHAARSFGSLKAVNDVSFAVGAGSITALIGPNGAGKTTMFNLIGGYQPLDRGTVRFAGREIERLVPTEIAKLGIARTFQNLQLVANMTVLENVMCGAHRLAKSGLLSVSTAWPSVRQEEAAARATARECLAFVGLDGADDLAPDALSFGHQRLVEIARALALRPVLLLMDEPASGLNDSETERLSELILRIAALGTTIFIVEHDMRLVMGLADRVVVMDHGEKMAEGTSREVRADPKVIAAYLGQSADAAAVRA